MKKILYLHGFNSAPASTKAQQTIEYFSNSLDVRVEVPALPPEPEKAIALCCDLLKQDCFSGIIGSSLGGYYGLYLHSLTGLPLVMINPAAKPYELLLDYVGVNTNMYTGDLYEVKPEHMQQLLALDVPASSLQMQKLYLMTQSGDEVLDYTQAATKITGCKMHIERGGDHSFQSYQERLPGIARFFSQTF